MLLYKYIGFDAGEKILENCSIGFSQPKYFNDPFDLPFSLTEDSIDAAEGIFAGFRAMIKNSIWAEKTGILALTRTPVNPLMWAHYADKHEGMVIGIDAMAAGFTAEDSNLIPAQFGSVIYVSERSDAPYVGKPKSGLGVGVTHSFPQDHYEKLQRTFLQKSICWSYEEEVRVLKCLDGISGESSRTQSGEFEIIDTGGRPLFLYALPKDAIKEVYFGFRSHDQNSEDLYYRINGKYPAASVYECKLHSGAMTVGFDRYVTIAEAAGD